MIQDQKPVKHLCPIRPTLYECVCLCAHFASWTCCKFANLPCRADNVKMDICSSAQHLANLLTANM